MATNAKAPDAMHFRSLHLENVRAFANSQSLEFFDEDGAISRWNLILGENGVGKTTLMQALAVMRPIPSADESTQPSGEFGPPKYSTAELSAADEDDEIIRFIRRSGTGATKMSAVLEADGATRLEVGVEISGTTKALKSFTPSKFPYALRSEGPLLIGYGAGRHVGHRNLQLVEERNATGSLFSDAIDLYDAEELIEKLDHAAKSDPGGFPNAIPMFRLPGTSLPIRPKQHEESLATITRVRRSFSGAWVGAFESCAQSAGQEWPPPEDAGSAVGAGALDNAAHLAFVQLASQRSKAYHALETVCNGSVTAGIYF